MESLINTSLQLEKSMAFGTYLKCHFVIMPDFSWIAPSVAYFVIAFQDRLTGS